jgi:hypothetical protein
MKRQSGVALIVVMVALLIMLTTVISIFRNTGGALGIIGNMGLKINATSVGDVGVEVARKWLMTKTNTQLAVSDAANGYFETATVSFDPVTYDWTAADNSVVATADDGTGNAVRYVTHRLCNLTGLIDAVGQQCVLSPPSNSGGSRQLGGAGTGLGITKTPVYRITVRVSGPRDTLSYSQVLVY